MEETLPKEEVESNDEKNEVEANAQDENRRIFTPGGGWEQWWEEWNWSQWRENFTKTGTKGRVEMEMIWQNEEDLWDDVKWVIGLESSNVTLSSDESDELEAHQTDMHIGLWITYLCFLFYMIFYALTINKKWKILFFPYKLEIGGIGHWGSIVMRWIKNYKSIPINYNWYFIPY